jgi:hypothetical protein
MKLLSELLILSEVKRKMDDEEKDLGELIEKYCDANRKLKRFLKPVKDQVSK